MARTRQPQGPVRIAPRWAQRVKLLSIGGQRVNLANTSFPTVTGAPTVSIGVGGRENRFVASSADCLNYPLTPILGAVSIFSIQTVPAGVSSAAIVSSCAAANDASNNPYFFAYIDSTNGLYTVRAGGGSSRVCQPNAETGAVAGSRFTACATWANGAVGTNPVYYVNGASYGVTELVSGTGTVAGGGGITYVGARDTDASSVIGIELAVVIDGAITAEEYFRLYANPYDELLASPRRIWIQLGAASGGAGTDAAIAGTQDSDVGAITAEATTAAAIAGTQDADVGTITAEATTGAAIAGVQAPDIGAITAEATTGAAIAGTQDSDVAALEVTAGTGSTDAAVAGTQAPDVGAITVEATLGLTLSATQASDVGYIVVEATLPASMAGTQDSDVAAITVTAAGTSIWTDISGSTTSWADQAAASTIWTDL